MTKLVKPDFCPLAKYILQEDRFLYNEAYLLYFDALSEQKKLKRFLSSINSKEQTFYAVSIRYQKQDYIVLVKYLKEQESCFFIFINSGFVEQIYQKLKEINSNDNFSEELAIIDQNDILNEILAGFISAYGVSADQIIQTAAVELEAYDQERRDFIIGKNSQIKWVIDTIKRIAPFDATVLLTGESGVGKNRFAEMIHTFSKRKKAPFITINCGAIPENLLESELFGYEKGAFTGASAKGKAGLIETADKGTLFLDEIGDLPFNMQVKLLKVIQEKKIMRVGGIQEKDVDFRLIAATNKDILGMTENGMFRKDLYFRLNVISILIPPIRKRKGDILHFVNYFTVRYNEKYGKNHVFSSGAIECMEKYTWPGNVRELENVVEGVILIADRFVITEDKLSLGIHFETAMEKYDAEGKTLKQILGNVEKQILLEAYEKYGTTTRVAKALGISQASVSLKLNKYASQKE